ncbi:AAA family ATPase, partial [Vibrio cholerae]
IIEALDDNLENSFKDTIVDKLKNIKSIEQIKNLKENPLLMKLLVKMSRQLKDSEEDLSAVNIVIDRFNKFTSDDKELDFTKNQIMVKVKGGEHSISELSSGERHILTLFTLLLDQGRNRDFIIIDEPEISLNSKWQEALLPTLTELLPNSQIIVASHSPIIVQSIDSLAELEVCS